VMERGLDNRIGNVGKKDNASSQRRSLRIVTACKRHAIVKKPTKEKAQKGKAGSKKGEKERK